MRTLLCTCGERKAKLWAAYFGGYLFIHCKACNRELKGPPISFPAPKSVAKKYKADLIRRWKDGESSVDLL